MDGYFTGVDACPDCITAGGSGGGEGDTGNVSSITGTSESNQSTFTECQSPNTGTYYNEYSENVTVTFLDTSGTPVIPNGTVEYSMDGGVNYTTVSVSSNTYTFPYSFTWRDVSVCSTADRIVGKIRINNISKFSWTAGLGMDE